jgi:hypothetical protein
MTERALRLEDRGVKHSKLKTGAPGPFAASIIAPCLGLSAHSATARQLVSVAPDDEAALPFHSNSEI